MSRAGTWLRRLVIGGLGCLALLLVYFVLFGPRGIGCGYRVVAVSGRLVDARTQDPIPGAYVMSLAVRSWAQDAELIERYRRWNAEAAEAAVQAGGEHSWFLRGSLNASGETRADGTFDLVLEVPCSTAYYGCLGGTRREGFAARDGAEALRVEIPGRDPITVDIPHGEWTEHTVESEPDVRWAWGDVPVP
ncbi:MAG: hypothetical protein QNJ90_16700 [Planctomycetota bacterium]|nr:hypothetical protein [Planctomycetota bacterium]